uniref:Reverse transcriptase domain-containing protein n=1 Tax=Cannabis sativa TaxID=3483 RepID=A0A803PAT7_CANSA
MGPILPSRGIRKGDPLSTYLFIIYAEGFSSLIPKFEANRILQGCRVARRAPSITHMLFIDDSYLFCQASLGLAESVLTLLNSFELASSQKVNVSKSLVFFSANIEASLWVQICTTLSMAEVLDGSLNLGLPNIIGGLKMLSLASLK